MSDDLALPERDDTRAIWVFTADLDPAAFKAFAKVGERWGLAEALGIEGLGPASVETFLASDLEGYGLERYLAEAHGMDPASVAQDAARLAAVEGPVVLLFSRDLPRDLPRGGTLDPAPPLAFVGRYDAPYNLAPAAVNAPRASTRGQLAGGGSAGERALLGRPLLITLAVLIALAALVLMLA